MPFASGHDSGENSCVAFLHSVLILSSIDERKTEKLLLEKLFIEIIRIHRFMSLCIHCVVDLGYFQVKFNGINKCIFNFSVFLIDLIYNCEYRYVIDYTIELS